MAGGERAPSPRRPPRSPAGRAGQGPAPSPGADILPPGGQLPAAPGDIGLHDVVFCRNVRSLSFDPASRSGSTASSQARSMKAALSGSANATRPLARRPVLEGHPTSRGGCRNASGRSCASPVGYRIDLKGESPAQAQQTAAPRRRQRQVREPRPGGRGPRAPAAPVAAETPGLRGGILDQEACRRARQRIAARQGSLTLASRWPAKQTTEDPAKSRERRHAAKSGRSNPAGITVKCRRNCVKYAGICTM